jgi:hypothetical protein
MNPQDIPLRDLHLPADIGWWPLAPGWWVLLAIAACVFCALLYRAFRRWRANRPRRAALKQLEVIARDYAGDQDLASFSKQLSELLRRALLAYAPRDEVAGLTGARWLEWLDRGLDAPLFATGPGRYINSLPYENPEARSGGVDTDALVEAVRTRLQTPLPEAAV